MGARNEKKWADNYKRLVEYVLEHKQLPDKKKEENRALLNWWKYNKKMIKQGRMDSERMKLLKELSEMRMSHELFMND